MEAVSKGAGLRRLAAFASPLDTRSMMPLFYHVLSTLAMLLTHFRTCPAQTMFAPYLSSPNRKPTADGEGGVLRKATVVIQLANVE
jgi:hypothetical protein